MDTLFGIRILVSRLPAEHKLATHNSSETSYSNVSEITQEVVGFFLTCDNHTEPGEKALDDYSDVARTSLRTNFRRALFLKYASVPFSLGQSWRSIFTKQVMPMPQTEIRLVRRTCVGPGKVCNYSPLQRLAFRPNPKPTWTDISL